MKTTLIYALCVGIIVATVVYFPEKVTWFVAGMVAGAFIVFGIWIFGAITEYYKQNDI